MKKLVFVFLSFTVYFCASAHAQDGMMVVWDSQMTGMVDYARTVSLSAAMRKKNKSSAGRTSAGSSTIPGKSSPPATAGGKTARLTFTPSRTVSARIKADFTKALVKANPQSAEEITDKLGRQDVIADFARDMSPYGLQADNIADAMTAYWITMWMIANQEQVPAAQKVSVVQSQIRASVTQNPRFVAMSDRERQEIAEGLIYETMLAFGMLNNAQSDPAKLQQLADDAQRNMLKKDVDLRGLRLTSSGFVDT